MFGPTIHDPVLRIVRRRWGKWRGTVSVPALNRDLELQVVIPTNEPVGPYLKSASNVIQRFDEFQNDLAEPLFDLYSFYRKLDIDQGTFTEEDFASYPTVNSAADVWDVLKPYRLWLGDVVDKHLGNAYLLMDVNWPNPHFLQVFVELTDDNWRHMHTEIVG